VVILLFIDGNENPFIYFNLDRGTQSINYQISLWVKEITVNLWCRS